MPVGDRFLVARALEESVLGVVLAGGKSSRFGADKSSAVLRGETLLSHVCRRAAPQVTALVINRNGGARESLPAEFDLLPDEFPGEGPLAGILAGLARARHGGHAFLATFACDTPFIPGDTVARLRDGLRGLDIDYCLARRGESEHRAIALWRVRCLEPLSAAFATGLRSLHGVSETFHKSTVEFPAGGEGPDGDAFFNINSVHDIERASRWLSVNR